VNDLSGFMKNCKFGMMTTRDSSSGHLVSRCMALAAQVSKHVLVHGSHVTDSWIGKRRHRPAVPHQHRVPQDRRVERRP
jgi:hypothetical protein